MLHLYPSNKTEHLAIVIAEIMKMKPLSAPFAHEVILIQSHGMGTWLQQEISQHLGIAAMIECSMPASFIWQLSQLLMPDDPHIPVFEKNNLRWQILERLPEKLADPRYESLANYIDSLSNSDSKASEHVLFELSDALADLFDAYQNYRPEWIATWEKGGQINDETCKHASFSDIESWQADLWCSLYSESDLENRNHRAILLAKLLERLKHCPAELQTHLPERVFIFGLSALPPQWLPILAALSHYCDVHFMTQNPCQYYWGDVVSPTQKLKLEQSLLAKGVSADTAADIFIEGNPLLASWGRLGRDYLSILFQHDGIKEMPVDLYEDASEECSDALAHLQADILKLQAIERQVSKTDQSIRFSACHSHLREVEALQDYLFKLLDDSAGDDSESKLSPKDVIVMMPDVQDFAALIDAVFSRPAYDQYGQAQYLPYGISDQMLAMDQPMVDVLSGILNLSTLRISATEVLDWLDIEAIRERFAISEEDLEQVHAWVSGLNIRWGLSEAHRDSCLSTTSQQIKASGIENTWISAFKRLLAGYVYGVNSLVLDGAGEVFAQSQYSRETQLLAGKLMRFVDVVEQTLNMQKGQHTIEQWLNHVSHFWESWFNTQYLSDEVQRLMDLSLTSLSEQVRYAGFSQEVSFAIVAEVIAAGFEKERVSQRFLAGRINFCTLMPMRSIPFKVVCMLGMNEGQYPRPEQKVSFDLLSISDSKVGDRSRREDDRYLFLEAICSARTNLYISYCGRDIKDNSERYPSLLVSELQDYCECYFYLDGEVNEASGSKLLNHWTVEHRLQPFHPFYFDTDATNNLPRTYSSDWLPLHHDTAHHLPKNTEEIKELSVESANQVPQFDLFQSSEAGNTKGRSIDLRNTDLNNLTRMADHPLRYYYRFVLGLSYTDIGAELDDSEPFALTHLDAYHLKAELVQSANPEAVFSAWKLSDKFPRSPVDTFYFEDAEASISGIKTQLENYVDNAKVAIDLTFDLSFVQGAGQSQGLDRVVGELLVTGGASQNLIELSLSKNIASRFFGFWVKHIFWNVHCGRLKREPENTTTGKSTLVSIDKIWTLPALPLELAERFACEILALFYCLENEPYAFLAKSTFALLFEKETQVKSAFKGVNIGSSVIQGERDDSYWQRYCMFSDDIGSLNNADELPVLNDSIFYKQVIDFVEQIEVDELVSPVVESEVQSGRIE